jgi:competence protein ComEC
MASTMARPTVAAQEQPVAAPSHHAPRTVPRPERRILRAVLARTAVAAAAGFAVGIATAGTAPLALALALAATAIGLACAFERFRVPAALLAIAALSAVGGAWRAEEADADASQAAALIQQFSGSQQIRGLVADDPIPRGRTTSLTLSDVLVRTSDGAWAPLQSRILVSVPQWPEHEYGEYLQLRGKLQPLQGSGAAEALVRQGVRGSMSYPRVSYLANPQASPVLQAIFGVRHALADAIHRGLPEPAAGTLAATLLGLRGELTKAQQSALVDTGTVHLVVISGFKLSLLAFFLMDFVAGVSRRIMGGHRGRLLTLAIVLAAIAGYTAMTGATPSSVRAAMMVGLVALARLTGRGAEPLAAVAIAMLAMLIHDPSALIDPGLQLSCLSVVGILVLSGPASSYAHREIASRLKPESPAIPVSFRRQLAVGALTAAVDALLVSGGATLAVLPVLAASFHLVSMVSPAANLIGMPLLGPVMLLGSGGAILALAVPAMAHLVLLPAWAAIQLLNLVIQLGASVPGSALPVADLPAPAVAAFYGALIALAAGLRRWNIAAARRQDQPASISTPKLLKPSRLALCGGAALAVELVVAAFMARPPATLRVTFLPVPGQAALIQTPAGQKVLIDGGQDGPELLRQLGQLLAPWDRRIDLVVVTDPKTDHISALEDLAARYTVGFLAAPAVAKPTATFRRVVAAAPEASADLVDLGDSTTLARVSDAQWRLDRGTDSIVFSATGAEVQPGGQRIVPILRGATPDDAALSLADTGAVTVTFGARE